MKFSKRKMLPIIAGAVFALQAIPALALPPFNHFVGGGEFFHGGGAGFGIHPHWGEGGFHPGGGFNPGWRDHWGRDWNWFAARGLIWNAESRLYYFEGRPCFYGDDGIWYYTDPVNGAWVPVVFPNQ